MSVVAALVALALAPPAAAAPVLPFDPPGLAAPLAEPVWLCRPGAPANPCAQTADGTATTDPFRVRYPRSGRTTGLDTISTVDGVRTVFAAPQAPPVDCCYVYPTVDTLPNPLVRAGANPPRATDTQFTTLLAQVGPMMGHCRIFAPVYRPLPLPGLLVPALLGGDSDFRLGQVDVEQAWRHYSMVIVRRAAPSRAAAQPGRVVPRPPT